MSTPSSHGMSGLTRISWPRSAASATEAILSTTTERISLPSGPGMEHAGQRHDLRETERVGGRPLPRRLAILAAAHGHERMRRGHAEHEKASGTQLHTRFARHALLRRREQRFDVAARGVELLAFVDELAVVRAHELLHAGLGARQCELLELAVRRQQDVRGRSLEGNPALRADDR